VYLSLNIGEIGELFAHWITMLTLIKLNTLFLKEKFLGTGFVSSLFERCMGNPKCHQNN